MREERILYQITQTPNCSFNVYDVKETIFNGIASLICEVETHHGYDVDYIQVTIPIETLAECLVDSGELDTYNDNWAFWENGDKWEMARLIEEGKHLTGGWLEEAVTWRVKELAEHLKINKNGLNKTLRAEAEAWGM